MERHTVLSSQRPPPVGLAPTQKHNNTLIRTTWHELCASTENKYAGRHRWASRRCSEDANAWIWNCYSPTQKRKRCTYYDQIVMHKHTTHKLLQATHTHNSHQSKFFAFLFFIKKNQVCLGFVQSVVQSCSCSGWWSAYNGYCTYRYTRLHLRWNHSVGITQNSRSIQARLCDYAKQTWTPAAGLETAPIDGWRHVLDLLKLRVHFCAHWMY